MNMTHLPAQVRQPGHFAAFHCTGAECEDTCCSGWEVTIDKRTHDKYRECGDPELKSSLERFIHITDKAHSDDNFAKIDFSGGKCPFLAGGLCSIHQKLGEEALSEICASFPRVMNIVDGVAERSLDMACPEAVRVALLNPEPMVYSDVDLGSETPRHGKASALTSNGAAPAWKPYAAFHGARAFVI
jgi:lysine-N-methylase